MRKSIRKTLWILFITGTTLLLCFFSFRNLILHSALKNVSGHFHSRFGGELTTGSSRFRGFLTVEMTQLVVTDRMKDTLLKADTISVRPSFWLLFSGTIRLKEVDFTGGRIHLSYKNGQSNFTELLRSTDKSKAGSGKQNTISYGETLYRLFNRAFNFAPQRADLNNIQFVFSNDTLARTLTLNTFHSDEDSLSGKIIDDKNNQWFCNGILDQSNHKVSFSIYPGKGELHELPLINDLYKLSVSFDTAKFSIEDYNIRGNKFNLHLNASLNNFNFHHWRIAADTIAVSYSSAQIGFSAHDSTLSVDSSSVIMLNAIDIHPFVLLANGKSKKVELKIKTGNIGATAFFKSLPPGMFDIVRGVEAEGYLSYAMSFAYETLNPDSVQFESSMLRKNFRIKKSGGLGKMNGEFLHSVYENDRLVRSFIVGPSNPNYTPLEMISPDFKNSVLTSEDGSFYWHNGFNEEAFRKSIVTNIKAKRFVRGGSTISMQLVKNVFLTRKKTIARKAEEALIVWLIESNRLYSKDRMFEVYLNIIELGPNIYGIGEASAFYFAKPPSEINLREGIFLASLLPHPKWFRYSFDANGNLKPYLADYYRVMANFMLRKELITQQQYDELQPVVELKGPAREMVMPVDTIPEEEAEPFF